MDLAQGSGGERSFVDGRELPEQMVSEFPLHDVADDDERLRRDFVLQPRELRCDFLRQHVDARGQELSDFDEDAAHLDGEPSKARGDSMQSCRASALHQGAAPQTRQHPLPANQPEHDARKKEHDAAIASRGRQYRAVPVIGWSGGRQWSAVRASHVVRRQPLPSRELGGNASTVSQWRFREAAVAKYRGVDVDSTWIHELRSWVHSGPANGPAFSGESHEIAS